MVGRPKYGYIEIKRLSLTIKECGIFHKSNGGTRYSKPAPRSAEIHLSRVKFEPRYWCSGLMTADLKV
ncbi:hypothetical protein PoB_001182400 [Plakobranchus ocellatus]|uniref:Uncharacterized protein n=1 Tax=Plakobranchus ocellatus TaxID=259542 RepID=A0AAV3YQI9_9GAST|nr:hypothetical protein PoB_001182400 [Plakobranchus ocellatus]